MYSYGGLKNKVSRYGWDEYEPYDDEPISRRDFGLSPELEDELMDNAVFLKKRVWRQMKKLKKHNYVDSTVRRRLFRSGNRIHFNHRPLHHF